MFFVCNGIKFLIFFFFIVSLCCGAVEQLKLMATNIQHIVSMTRLISLEVLRTGQLFITLHLTALIILQLYHTLLQYTMISTLAALWPTIALVRLMTLYHIMLKIRGNRNK